MLMEGRDRSSLLKRKKRATGGVKRPAEESKMIHGAELVRKGSGADATVGKKKKPSVKD